MFVHTVAQPSGTRAALRRGNFSEYSEGFQHFANRFAGVFRICQSAPATALLLICGAEFFSAAGTTVDREGRIALPEIGPVLVNGQTLANLQQTLQTQLRTPVKNISVDVSLTRLRSVRVYVVGDVEHAGAYDISSLSTPLNALLAAGGPTVKDRCAS